jgi:D-threo-aldose 1-dehydrogenase
MNYRRFGRTGLEISELVLGAGWVGGLIITASEDEKRAAIRTALARGINWIDTAPSYGDGRSEEALGWLLEEVDHQPYLSTKVRLDPARLDDIPGQVEESMAASLKRLRREAVDLIQLHNPIARQQDGHTVSVDQVLGPRGVAAAFERLREQGTARHLGITALGETEALKQVLDSGRFETAQVYFNMLNPSAVRPVGPAWSTQSFAGLVEACRANDIGVMNIRVLAAGVLATTVRHGREGMITHKTDLADEERRAKMVHDVLGGSYGTSAQTALRFALAHEDIHGVVVGVEKLVHLEEALDAATMGPLPAEALARLDELYASDFTRSR